MLLEEPLLDRTPDPDAFANQFRAAPENETVVARLMCEEALRQIQAEKPELRGDNLLAVGPDDVTDLP